MHFRSFPVRGGGRDALSYGVSFATTGRTSWLRGATASFLSGIFGLALSLNPLARGCRRNLARRNMEVWLRRRRRRFRFSDFRFEAAARSEERRGGEECRSRGSPDH